jgi:GTPase SAR1 family protein
MNKLFFTLIFMTFVASGFSKNPEGKSFLILFNKSELKQHRTSIEYIELSLMNIFKTKAYTGNSDAAIMVQVPIGNFDKCQLGDMMIRLNAKSTLTLDEIAFQIVDIEENKSTYQLLLASYEDKIQKARKNNRAIKSVPAP